MQIKQTNAAIYASLILILTFELSFSQSILANLAVFMGCVIFLIGQRKSRLLLWLFFLPLLPAIGTFWSIYLHGTSSQQAWLLFSRTYAFAGLGLAFAVGVDFEELLLLLEQKGLAPNFVYGILVVVHALPEVKREINDLKEASLLRGRRCFMLKHCSLLFLGEINIRKQCLPMAMKKEPPEVEKSILCQQKSVWGLLF